MAMNLIKSYPELLELAHLDERDRKQSLMSVFRRDIELNENFQFRGKKIRPIKNEDGEPATQTLFHHLTTCSDESPEGKQTKRRLFEYDRARRLHWIRVHVEEQLEGNIIIFSYIDRIDGRDKCRTYIYNTDHAYVIILELQNSGKDYYLITAYHLNQKQGRNQIENKLKKKLDYIF
ncbi:MAG: hypothetical protein NW218_21405 [Saprospiraceae bacterium]|nr:hypothetical protein [Saprospiraceae bacterium]